MGWEASRSQMLPSVTQGLAGAEWVSRRRMRFVTGSAVVLANCGLDIGAEGSRAAGTRGQAAGESLGNRCLFLRWCQGIEWLFGCAYRAREGPEQREI